MKNSLSLFIAFYLLFFSNFTFSQCMLDKSQWQLVFDEEFDGPTLQDLLNNGWIVGEVTSTNNTSTLESQSCGSDKKCDNTDLLAFSGTGLAEFGARTISNSYLCEQNYVNSEGIGISTTYNEYPTIANFKPGYLYGMFEIRCKLPSTKFTYPAFWLSGAAWPPEIDVFEYHGGDKQFFSSVHWGIHDPVTNTHPACSRFFEYPFAISDEFHTWTVVWTPTEISWFFDGKEIVTERNSASLPGYAHSNPLNAHQLIKWSSMHVILGNGLQCAPDGYSEDVDVEPLIVDYVKIYKPANLPTYDPATQTVDNHYRSLLTTYANTPYKTNADWISNVIIPKDFYPAEDTEPYKSDLTAVQGGGKYYYKGKWDLLWTTYWDNGLFYNTPVDWNFRVDDEVVPTRNGDVIFYRYNNDIYYNFYNNGTSSFNFINVAAHYPYAYNVQSDLVPNNTGTEIIYRTTNSSIWGCTTGSPFPPTTWNCSQYSAITNDVKSDVIVDPNNFHQIYFISYSQQVKTIYKDINGQWFQVFLTTLPASGVGDVYSDLSITKDGNRIYYRTSNNELKYIDRATNNGTFNYWNVTTTPQYFQAKMYGTGTPIAVNNVKEDILTSPDPLAFGIYYVGTDDRPWTIYYDAGTGDYSAVPIHWNFGKVKSDFRLITMGQSNPNQTHISYVGTDNRIRTLAYDSPCEVNSPCNDPTNPIYKKEAFIDSNNRISLNQKYYYNSSNIDKANNSNNNTEVNNISSKIAQKALYPNPTTGKVIFTSDEKINSIEIQSIDGKALLRKKVRSATSVELDISEFAKGVYILRVYCNSDNYSYKLSKQ